MVIGFSGLLGHALVQVHQSSCVMKKTLLECGHESPSVCQSLGSSGTSRVGSWAALIRCLYPAPLPDRVSLQSQTTSQSHCSESRLCHANRPQCHPCL